MTEQKHLWEYDHDYYGADGGYQNSYESFADFLEDWDHWEPGGMNFLYRFDWHDWREERKKYPEETGPDFELQVFYLLPRKDVLISNSIAITPEEEPAVREWLKKHWNYIKELWAPISEER